MVIVLEHIRLLAQDRNALIVVSKASHEEMCFCWRADMGRYHLFVNWAWIVKKGMMIRNYIFKNWQTIWIYPMMLLDLRPLRIVKTCSLVKIYKVQGVQKLTTHFCNVISNTLLPNVRLITYLKGGDSVNLFFVTI